MNKNFNSFDILLTEKQTQGQLTVKVEFNTF